MRITTLVDNLVYPRNLIAEHGLSFYIEVEQRTDYKNKERVDYKSIVGVDHKLLEETGNRGLGKTVHKILFDCGQSSIFAQNAQNLGIDLKTIDTVVISHGHYDHAGGLEKFLEINKTAKIYIKQEALLEKYSSGRYVGTPKELTLPQKRLVFPTEQITQISESLYLVSFPKKEIFARNINNTNGSKTTSAQNKNIETGFTILQNGEHVKDYFNDEHYLIYKKNNKISLITGCSHRGILQIIALVENLFNLPVCEIIGGLHTQKQSKEEIEVLAEALNKTSVQSLRINHCTGVKAFALLKANLRANTSYNYTGNLFKSNI